MAKPRNSLSLFNWTLWNFCEPPPIMPKDCWTELSGGVVPVKLRNYAFGLAIITHCNLSVACFQFYCDCHVN